VNVCLRVFKRENERKQAYKCAREEVEGREKRMLCVCVRERAHVCVCVCVCVCGRCMNRKENVGYFVSEPLCVRDSV
jgi:hypothetical protein